MSDQIGIGDKPTAPVAVPAAPAAGLRNAHANPRPVRVPVARQVRWRFDYHGKPSKFGQWSRAGTKPEDMAAFQSKENLARAAVEVKEMLTAKVYVIAECAGPDFVNFSWRAGAVAAMQIGMKGERTLRSQILGLELITRDQRCIVMMDGTAPQLVARTEEEKRLNYAGFGK